MGRNSADADVPRESDGYVYDKRSYEVDKEVGSSEPTFVIWFKQFERFGELAQEEARRVPRRDTESEEEPVEQ